MMEDHSHYKQKGWRILVAACFLICALAGVAPAQPNWFKKPPNDARYYYGVGMSTESMEKAKDKARAELTKAISSTIEVRQEYRVDSKGEGKDEEIDRKYSDQMRITATLKSLPEINSYRSESENGRQGTKHYALVRLERIVFQKYIQEQWDKVRDMVAHGDLSIKTRDVVTALREYSKALDKARTLPFRDQKKLLSDIGIEYKITLIENDLEIKAVSGNEQVGTYGGSLAEALIVQVHYQGSPFESFPLWATYTRGTGQLRNSSGEMGRSVRVPTDANGQAIFGLRTSSRYRA